MFSKERIEKLQSLKTPFYLYDLELLKKTVRVVTEEAGKYGYIVHYALKANANAQILQLIKDAGLGADCVSGKEVEKAVELGFSADHIAFAGVGKTDEEINYAIDQDIFTFNCESSHELQIINELAEKKGKKAGIALRINPNVNAYTHHYITTGLEENKFGINMWEMEDVLNLLKELPNLELKGLHFHIGSQITDLTAFKNLCIRVNEIQQWFLARKVTFEHINVGGGLGVDYHHPDEHLIPDFTSYFKIFDDFLELQPGQKVHFELGRAIVAQCGNLISRVLYIKNGINTNFAILDAGMTELIRPALYQSYHKIENISKADLSSEVKYDVVGPICESSDCFGKAVDLPQTERGDLFAIRTAGAYGEVMASAYNLREQNKAVFSSDL
jgi:diaminopimelate decarboxylase